MHLPQHLFNKSSLIYYLFMLVILLLLPATLSTSVGINDSEFFRYDENDMENDLISYDYNLTVENKVTRVNDNVTEFFINKFNDTFVSVDEIQVSINDTDYCEHITCVRKCCGFGEVMKDLGSQGSNCTSDDRDLQPRFHSISNWKMSGEVIQNVTLVSFGVQYELKCDKFLLEPEYNPGDEYFLNSVTGHLHVRDFEEPLHHGKYCLEHVDYGDGNIKLEAFVCFEDSEEETAIDTHAVAMTVSIVFFSLTLLTYACLPKMRNMHGKMLMGNVSSFLLAYLIITVNRFQHSWHEEVYCEVSAYLIYFGTMSGFLWLNVMCFDIWGTMKSIKASHGGRKRSDHKKFICYSLYSLVTPCLLISIMLSLQFTEVVPYKWRPKLGFERCWFDAHDDALPRAIFFLLPVGVITICNCFLFVATVIHCNKIKADIQRMQQNSGTDTKKRFEADKARLIMSAKLFIVMGATWLLEVVSTLFPGPTYLWFVTDFFNSLLGVFVFLIFICKRKVFLQIKKRLGCKVAPPNTVMTDTTSLRTFGRIHKASSMTSVQLLSVNPARKLNLAKKD